MRRTWWSRSLGAVMALWLALVLGDAGLVHACPMHGGAPSAATASGTQQQDSPAAAEGHHHQAEPVPDAPQDHACTCPGDCTAAGSAGVLPPDETVLVAATLVAEAAAQPVDAHTRPREAAARLLPYPNGPPRG